MKISFDVISDLHVDEWEDFNWSNQATSPFCIIAGDTARDRDLLAATLEHISNQYQQVFVVDGNEEHRWTYNNLNQSYEELKSLISSIPNVAFLHNNIVMLEGIAIVGTCGWYTFNNDPRYSIEQCKKGVENHYGFDRAISDEIEMRAVEDARYLNRTISKLQLYPDIENIVVVTHFLPYAKFAAHDTALLNSYVLNASTNVYLPTCFQEDTERKISHWVYGHYHGQTASETIGHTKFITNPHGRRNSSWHQNPYFPQRITFD